MKMDTVWQAKVADSAILRSIWMRRVHKSISIGLGDIGQLGLDFESTAHSSFLSFLAGPTMWLWLFKACQVSINSFFLISFAISGSLNQLLSSSLQNREGESTAAGKWQWRDGSCKGRPDRVLVRMSSNDGLGLEQRRRGDQVWVHGRDEDQLRQCGLWWLSRRDAGSWSSLGGEKEARRWPDWTEHRRRLQNSYGCGLEWIGFWNFSCGEERESLQQRRWRNWVHLVLSAAAAREDGDGEDWFGFLGFTVAEWWAAVMVQQRWTPDFKPAKQKHN